jgi:hypothetical protein
MSIYRQIDFICVNNNVLLGIKYTAISLNYKHRIFKDKLLSKR